MSPHSKTITRQRLYPKYSATPLAHRLVLILLGMPSHAQTTALNLTVAPSAIDGMGELMVMNLSAGHVQSPGTGEETMRERRRASSLSSDTPYPGWTLCPGGASWA